MALSFTELNLRWFTGDLDPNLLVASTGAATCWSLGGLNSEKFIYLRFTQTQQKLSFLLFYLVPVTNLRLEMYQWYLNVLVYSNLTQTILMFEIQK